MKRESVRAGFSVGWIVVILLALVSILVLYPLFPRSNPYRGKFGADLSNLKQIGIGQQMYMEDHDGYGPPPDQWMDALFPYVKVELILVSPGLDSDAGEYGYAYLRDLWTVRLSDVQNPRSVPAVFDSYDLERNVAGGLELLPALPRWGEHGNNIGFLDGHASAHTSTPEYMIELP